VVKTDPADSALLDGFCEGGGGCGCPIVGWIVELNEKLILREKSFVDEFGVFDVVDSEVVGDCFMREPDFGCVHEWLMYASAFCDSDDLKRMLRGLCCEQ
jgi:hypothetical protein